MAASTLLLRLIPVLLLIAVASANPSSIRPTPRILAADAPAAAGPASSSTPAAPATPTAPAAAPPADLVSIMSKKGCKSFASLLSANPDVLATFQSDVDGGLTVFCPVDHAVSGFTAHYKNLTADGKASLLLFHGVPVYYSLSSLRTSNGEMNTLATDGTARNFNFTVLNAGEKITIKTGVATASILSTVYDSGSLAVFAVSDVLQPQDLFKPVEAPAPAPAPEKPKGKKKKGAADASAPAADSPDATPADQKAADENTSGAAERAYYWTAAACAVTATVVAGVVMGF